MHPPPRGLFGRDRELAEADVALATAASGAPQALLIGGDAGIGKTSVRVAVAERAVEQGFAVLVGHCLDIETGVPLGPVREALRFCVAGRADESLPPVTRRLAPFLRAHAAPEAGSPTALLEDLCLVVAELAREKPLMLVLEDIHWADRSTQDFAVALAGTMRGSLLFVLTYRRDDLTRRHPVRRALVEIGRGAAAIRLDLQPLDRGGVAGIVRTVTGSEDPPLVSSLLARSEGNPLFAEELLASQRAGVPDHLCDLLLARVDSLTPATRDLLRLASVDGSRIDQELLGWAANLEAGDVDACLREGLDANVVTSADGHLDFRHGLLREAVYDDLMPGERARAHADLANALQAQMGLESTSDVAALGRLAFHRYAAHELPQAFAASVRAGLAAKQYGGPGSVAHLERALDLWDRVPQAETLGGVAKADVLRLLCEAHDEHGDRDKSDRYILAAMEELTEVSDPLLASRIHSTYGLYSFPVEGHPRQRDALEMAVGYAEGEPSEELAKALNSMASYFFRRGSAGPAIANASRAADVARAAHCPHERLRAELVLGAALFDSGRCGDGVAHVRKAIEVAESAGEVGQSVGIGGQLAFSLMLMGEVLACLEVAEAGRSRALALGFPDDAAFNGEQSVQALQILGRLDDADQLLEELRTLGMQEWRWRFLRSDLLLARGELEAALSVEGETMTLLDGSVTHPDPFHVVRQADLLIAAELVPEALSRTNSYLSSLGDADAPLTFALAARAAHSALVEAGAAGVKPPEGMPERADDVMGRAVAAMTDEWSRTFQAAECLHALALAHTLTGDPALREWRSAEAAASRFGAYHVLRTRLGLANALLETGERDEARVLLLQTWQSAHDMGALLFEKQAAQLARRHRIPLPDDGAVPRQLAALTAREREVLGVLVTGATNRAIAERLFISEKTVSVHVTNVLAKLGVPNRGEAAALARELASAD